ncbi:hypothetical protein D3C78_534480 [compost metagenome]
MNVISHGIAVDFSGAAFLGAQAAGEVAEVVGSQGNVGVEGFADGFAVVPSLGNGQQFEVLFDAVGDLQQDQRACLHRGGAPGISGGMGRVQGFFDVFGSGAWEFGDQLAVHRGSVFEVLPFDRRNELATNVVAITALEGNLGAFGTGMCVTHGVSPGYFVCWEDS